MGFLGAFAGGAVAGDVFLVAEAIAIGIVDFSEFVANVFEKCFFDFAGDTDVDFIAVAGFDDFGLRIVVFQDYAVFPDEFAIDKLVHFDDEAGEHSLRHEFVAVAQDEIVAVVPGIFGLVD